MVEVRIITEDYDREKVATFSRSFNNFLGRTLEKCPEKRSTMKEVAHTDLASSRLMDQGWSLTESQTKFNSCLVLSVTLAKYST